MGRREFRDSRDSPFLSRPQALETTPLKPPIHIAIAHPVAGDPAIKVRIAAEDAVVGKLSRPERPPGEQLGEFEAPAAHDFSRIQPFLKAASEGAVEARNAR